MAEEFVEECWFIYGFWVGKRFFGIKRYQGKGTHGSVDFDWKKCMGPRTLGWVHTHPPSCGTNPSSTDDKTMRSWIKGLARPMICAIACGPSKLGVMHVSWYLYYRGEDFDIKKIDLEVIVEGDFIFGKRP